MSREYPKRIKWVLHFLALIFPRLFFSFFKIRTHFFTNEILHTFPTNETDEKECFLVEVGGEGKRRLTYPYPYSCHLLDPQSCVQIQASSEMHLEPPASHWMTNQSSL